MTYEELMNNEQINFVMFRPNNDTDALRICKKKAVGAEDLENHTFRCVSDDMAEFVKSNG